MKTSKIVIGAGFGDEGKGRVVSFLASQLDPKNTMVVRFNGGHQVGHTVVKNNIRHVFSSFGSGTLHNIPTYWGPQCTVYPTALLYEYNILCQKGLTPQLYINVLSPVTTPFDIDHNMKTAIHGSVGVGFGSTLQRQEDHYKLHFIDLYHEQVLKIKLENIADYYKVTNKQAIVSFVNNIKLLLKLPSIGPICELPINKYNVIYEGAQGLLLDKDHGFFPYVTRSNTTSKDALAMAGGGITSIYYVTRCYQTRHGKGPMTNENTAPPLVNNEKETNVTNTFQGNFRTRVLDIDLLFYALEIDYVFSKDCDNKYLVVTCLDQISKNYPITVSGKTKYCKNREDLICTLQSYLPVNKVLTSDKDSGELV